MLWTRLYESLELWISQEKGDDDKDATKAQAAKFGGAGASAQDFPKQSAPGQNRARILHKKGAQ